ncbi:MAG TPA: ABC transporter substrate-binding protein [Acidimicrobiia bacterium]|nr:ABC transporter substrate-binding protein [Acidimicrobiia bacterium]
MRGTRRWVVLVGALGLVGALLPTAAAARPQQQQPAGGEIGVTADTIRIAVIADVDNAARPGLFQGSVDGVNAFAKFVNANGGLAGGRKVQVDFIDSKLSADEARNALVRACQEDFAIVGTTALFMNNIEPMTSCVDQAGKATGLPDVPVLQTEIQHQCSPISFPVIVVGLDCATKDAAQKKVTTRTGAAKYFTKRNKGLHGVFTLAGDLKSTVNAALPLVETYKSLGVKSDGEFKVSGLSPQAAYTPIVQAIKQNGSTYALNNVDYKADVFLRREAQVQGANTVKVWDCALQCYDRRLLEEGKDAVEGQYVSLFFIPFEEAKQNKSVSDYLKNVGGRDKADGFGAQAWTAGLFFRDVVNNVVKADGDNGLTRARFLEEAAKVHDFTADGMLGPTDVGGRKVSPCGVILQVKNGKFVRVSPKKKGTLDCSGGTKAINVTFE